MRIISVVLLVLVVCVAGCHNISMTNPQKADFAACFAKTNAANDKCQAGDPNACIECLKDANDTLVYVLASTSIKPAYREKLDDAQIRIGEMCNRYTPSNRPVGFLQTRSQNATKVIKRIVSGIADSNQ